MAWKPLQDPMLDSAMHAMHNLNYERSLAIFREMEGNIYAPLGKLLVEWYRGVGLYGHNFDKKILIGQSDELIAFYEKALKENPDSTELNLCAALAIGFKSRIMVSDHNSFFVMLNGIESLKYLRRVDELSTDNPDLEFSKGVFEYYISKYPGIIQYFANLLLDTTGDRESGRARMHRAAESEGFLKYDANFLLAFLYLYIENNPDKAREFIDLLVREFPKNPNYHFLKTFYFLQRDQTEAAELSYEQFINSIDVNCPYYLHEFRNRKDFLAALIALKKQDLKKAYGLFQSFLENYGLELEHLKAIALLEQGKIQDFWGNSKEARKFYKAVIKVGNNTYPIHDAEVLLKR
ncbi:MAG: tetratricopeptide repeat protein [Candidatus Marinimicrobia bacterium]|nr:tetratricopeptide repeat protein [Candidatus Neomarinimicrobiota bacterium]